MKTKISLLILIIFTSSLHADDPSTPNDGNLYIAQEGTFHPERITIYHNNQILTDYQLTLDHNRIIKKNDVPSSTLPENATTGSNMAWINEKSYVILTGSSSRYQHGILGDTIESTGFEIYKNNSLTAKYELQYEEVFETLRPLTADVVLENPGPEIILTTSNQYTGSRIEIYSLNGILLGASDPIGRSYRWLHIIAAAPFGNNDKPAIAVVKTPHINGTLELYIWNGKKLSVEAALTDVSTHQIGSDNLNMALVMDLDGRTSPELLVPSVNFSQLYVIKYQNKKLRVIRTFDLPAQLATNILYTYTGEPSIWMGLTNGQIVRLSEK